MRAMLELGGWAAAGAALAAALALRAQLTRRGELVSHACHELRGPLTAARLGLATLARAGESQGARTLAIDQELRRAGLALEDLDAARAGRRAREREETVDLGALVQVTAQAWRPVAQAVGGEVRTLPVPGTALVRGDRIRLAQAFGNLLANAIEHGGGDVELRAHLDARRVRVEVRDQGPGLPMTVGALATRGGRRGRGRRGHGLAIATEIVTRHGGRLGAGPTPRGARVSVELPLVPPRTGIGS